MSADPDPHNAGRRRLEFVAASFFAFAAACGVYAASSRGIWIDEFWSLRMGDAAIPLEQLAEQRWLHETNPITANMLYRIVSYSGASDIAVLRIIFNLPPFLLLLAATAGFHRASPSRSPFYLLFAVLVVALPAFITAFSDYRSYVWQIGWGAILVQFAHWLLVEPPAPALPRNRALAALAIASVFGAIAFHFIAGLLVSALVAGLLLMLARSRAWRAFAAVAVPAVIVWSTMLGLALWQYSHVRRELDYSWITTTTPQALIIGAALMVEALLANPVASVLALLRQPAFEMVDRAAARRRLEFILLLGASIFAAAAPLLLLNAYRPVVVDRYLGTWQLLIAGIVAVAGCRAVAAHRWAPYAVAVFAVISVGVTARRQADYRGWNETRDFIASGVRNCPASTVYATTPWRLRTGRDTRYAAYESLTFADGYRRLAKDAGFELTVLSPEDRVLALADKCPTYLWAEHTGGWYLPDGGYVLGKAGLRPSAKARATIFRTNSGFVVVLKKAA